MFIVVMIRCLHAFGHMVGASNTVASNCIFCSVCVYLRTFYQNCRQYARVLRRWLLLLWKLSPQRSWQKNHLHLLTESLSQSVPKERGNVQLKIRTILPKKLWVMALAHLRLLLVGCLARLRS